jgi:hypothetical protein
MTPAQLCLYASPEDGALARLLVAGDSLIAAEAVLRGYRSLGPVIERELREQWLQWIDVTTAEAVIAAVRAWSLGTLTTAHVDAAHAAACAMDVRWLEFLRHKTRKWNGEVAGHA